MLVLSRNIGEEIVLTLPDQSTVTLQIVDVSGRRVRLGFTAPQSVGIHRSEVLAQGRVPNRRPLAVHTRPDIDLGGEAG